eukprot:1173925-Prorocentrum_minimum.AAC.6
MEHETSVRAVRWRVSHPASALRFVDEQAVKAPCLLLSVADGRELSTKGGSPPCLMPALPFVDATAQRRAITILQFGSQLPTGCPSLTLAFWINEHVKVHLVCFLSPSLETADSLELEHAHLSQLATSSQKECSYKILLGQLAIRKFPRQIYGRVRLRDRCCSEPSSLLTDLVCTLSADVDVSATEHDSSVVILADTRASLPDVEGRVGLNKGESPGENDQPKNESTSVNENHAKSN